MMHLLTLDRIFLCVFSTATIYLIDMVKAEPKTQWGKHVRAWMDTHPGVSYKDALKQAKDSYQGAKQGKPVKPIKVKPMKERTISPWIEHIKSYHANHPALKFGDAMREAKVTYGVAKVAPIVNSGVDEKKQTGKGVADEVMEEMQRQSGSGKVRKPDLTRLHEEIGRIELEYSSVAKRHKEYERDSKIREVMTEHGESEDGHPAAPEEIEHYETKIKKVAPVEKIEVPIVTVRPLVRQKYARCVCGRRVCSCASIDNCC